MPFKMLSHSSRYDFPLPRYRRVKGRLIFNRFYFRPFRLFGPLVRTNLSQTADKRQTGFLEKGRTRFLEKHSTPFQEKGSRSVAIHNLRAVSSVVENFDSLYFGNRLRYRNEWKKDFNGKAFPIVLTRFQYQNF